MSEIPCYTVYFAGGLFTQHDLTTNVLIKESVWRQSYGKFELILPQSKELGRLDSSDMAAMTRNSDLFQAFKNDIILARFDGLEIDTGTLVEFMFAKFLGKPAVILRTDSRGFGIENMEEPYNLMVKNWPRTVEIHFDSLINYLDKFSETMKNFNQDSSIESKIKSEVETAMKGVDEIARQIILGVDKVLQMESPYPESYQELVYQAARYCPGCGFELLISEFEIKKIIERFREIGTL
jgi:nucleoside 2-deoxyribosyltransferase